MTRSSRRTPAPLSRLSLIALAGAAALALLLLAVPPEPAAAKVLVGQKATLTKHANGMPTTTVPGRRLQRAEVEVQIRGGGTDAIDAYAEAHVTLQGVPATTYDDDAVLLLGFGNAKGQSCEIRHVETKGTSGNDGRDYEVIENFRNIGAKWDCVVVALDDGFDGTPTVTYDAMVSPLEDQFASPKPKITGVELLRKKQKTLRLVRGAWTTLDVEVENTATVEAKSFRVTGGGKKLKVRASRADELPADWERTAEIKVKPVGKIKRSKLKIVATADGVKTSRSLKVKAVKPPKRPANGTYESENGWVDFRIKNGRVVGWRGYMQTQCGGYPDLPSYTMNTYDFPKVKVPRNGIVNATDKRELYTVSLEMRAVGKKVTSGWFFYGGPARCTASTAFTAKRVGR